MNLWPHVEAKYTLLSPREDHSEVPGGIRKSDGRDGNAGFLPPLPCMGRKPHAGAEVDM